MPIRTVISESQHQRLVLTHYAPDEECRAHRHAGEQNSLLIAGGYVEESDTGTLTVQGLSISYKSAGFEHQNRFGSAGALILSRNGPPTLTEAADYRVSPSEDLGDSLSQVMGVGPHQSRADMQTGHRPSHARAPSIPVDLAGARDCLTGKSDMSIPLVARSMGLHPVYFARLFRNAFGHSPAQLRRNYRTARAINKIVRTSASLAHIACDEGFADQAHMTRTISQACGWSPAALRRLLR